MATDLQTANEIRSALLRMTDAYGRRDVDVLINSFVPDVDLITFGSGIEDVIVGRSGIAERLRRDSDRFDSLSFQWQWFHVSGKGNVAWLASEGNILARRGVEDLSQPVRLTAVLERRGKEWLFAQLHLSSPSLKQFDDPAWSRHEASYDRVRN